VSTVTERVGAPAVTAGTCEAVSPYLGITVEICGDPAIGRFARSCVHEHVRTGRLCRWHAEAPERGLCLTCWELPGDLSHECPIGITEVTG
jgi:hypothetical protein